MNPARRVDPAGLPPQVAAAVAALEDELGAAAAVWHGRLGALAEREGPPVAVHGRDPRELGYLVMAGRARVLLDARSGERIATALGHKIED